MRIIIGTQNPKKIEAVEEGFKECIHTENSEIKTIPLDAPSDVSDMPLTIEETILGARNRAKFCKRLAPDGDYFVGIEGGTTVISDIAFLFGVICIIDKNGRENSCVTTMLQLPSIYKKRLYEDNKDLNEIDEELMNIKDNGIKGGTYSVVTGGAVDRKKAMVSAVTGAISRFYSEIK